MTLEEIISDIRLHREKRSASVFASDRVYALIDEIDLLRRHRDELHLANDRYVVRARDVEAKIREVAACFDAADAEGFQERINEEQFCHVGSWSDLVIRRLLPAGELARSHNASTAPVSAELQTVKNGLLTCQCENSITDPCIVCGKGKTLVTAEWVRKMAAKEGDLDCTTGRPEPQPVAWGAAAVEKLAEWLCAEFDFSLNPCVGFSWPTHADDDGYRGDDAWVRLQPPDVQGHARDNARRIIRFLRGLEKPVISPPDLAAEIERFREALRPFADVADFMDSETDGFSADDNLSLIVRGDDGEESALIKDFHVGDFYRARAALADQKGGAIALPPDVTELVIAAREFWEMHNDLSSEASALDKALEAFSNRVPYETQPEEDT